MMFVSMEVNGGDSSYMVACEENAKACCCIAVSSRQLEQVRLTGDFCALGEELLLSETEPDLWIAWLLLPPGSYRCTIVARIKSKNCSNVGALLHPVRQEFVLTIPDFRLRGFHVANVRIVRRWDASRNA